MKNGSEYRYSESYKLTKVGDQDEGSGDKNVPKGHRTPSLPTVRDDPEGGMLTSEVLREPKTPNKMAEEKEYFLKPLSEDPGKYETTREKAREKVKEKAEKKKYIGDDVITSFLQGPLTTILYGSHRNE